MNARVLWGISIGLVIVALLAVFLLMSQGAKAPAIESGTTSTQALHDKVLVTSPKSGTTVGKTFTVTGEAPGNWYGEGSFPVQVRDKNNNTVGQDWAEAQVQVDWMTAGQVPFKVDITVAGYSGPATLVLLMDSGSGLPEHEDSISVPIVIK